MKPGKPDEVTFPSLASHAAPKDSMPLFSSSHTPREMLARRSMNPGKPEDVTVPSFAFQASTKARTPRAPSSKKPAIPETSRLVIQSERPPDISLIAEEKRGCRISHIGEKISS